MGLACATTPDAPVIGRRRRQVPSARDCDCGTGSSLTPGSCARSLEQCAAGGRPLGAVATVLRGRRTRARTPSVSGEGETAAQLKDRSRRLDAVPPKPEGALAPNARAPPRRQRPSLSNLRPLALVPTLSLHHPPFAIQDRGAPSCSIPSLPAPLLCFFALDTAAVQNSPLPCLFLRRITIRGIAHHD